MNFFFFFFVAFSGFVERLGVGCMWRFFSCGELSR